MPVATSQARSALPYEQGVVMTEGLVLLAGWSVLASWVGLLAYAVVRRSKS